MALCLYPSPKNRCGINGGAMDMPLSAARWPPVTVLMASSTFRSCANACPIWSTAMKICGGAAFRKELGIERRFRDARAARVMAPTTDALLDFDRQQLRDQMGGLD